jgi:hypothetical protein
MDAKLHVSLLREHSEHLRKLATDLNEKLEHLEGTLAEPQSPSETEAGNPLAGMAMLNDQLFDLAYIFHWRFCRFLTQPPEVDAEAKEKLL